MKKVISAVMAIVMVLSVCALFAACTKTPDETNNNTTNEDVSNKEAVSSEATEIKTAKDGVLLMATEATFPPYEYMEGEKIIGLDVEIAEKIAEKLGMTLEIENVPFDSIIGGVQTGKYDVGFAGLSVTPDRLKSVNFSDFYITGARQVVIVSADSEITDTQNLKDLATTETVKIGVQQGTTGDLSASKSIDDGGFGEENVVRYNNGADAVQALKSGKVNAVIIDNEPAKSFVAANDGLRILETAYEDENYAIAVAKDNDGLLAAINGALAELKADGTLQQLIDKYIPAE